MIRIRSIELSNVKNVANGTIGFKDSPFGSSVMGIYGQNGSGKTAVVESLARVQDLMCGFPLDRESVDLIGPSAECAKISIEVEVTEGSPSSLGFVGGLGGTVAAGKPFTVCYSFSFDRARRQTAPPLRGPLRPRRGARQEKARRLRCGRYRGQPEPEARQQVAGTQKSRRKGGRPRPHRRTALPRPAGLLEAVLERHGRLRGRREKVLSRAPRK